jgi:hypothetical protein
LILWIFISLLVIALLACANDSKHFFLEQVNLSDGVILCVTEVKEMLFISEDVADALRVMEACLVVGSIDQANQAIANGVDELMSLCIHNHDPVVAGVADHQERLGDPLLLLNTNAFAWEFQILTPCIKVN